MLARQCSYTKSDGLPCRAVALRGSRLCRHHTGQAARYHRSHLALNSGRTVRLGRLATRADVHRAFLRLLPPLAAGTLPLDRAGRYLCRIQLALAAVNARERFAAGGLPFAEDEEDDDAMEIDLGIPYFGFRLSPEIQEIFEEAFRAAGRAAPTAGAPPRLSLGKSS